MNSAIEHQLDTFDPEGHPELKAAYDECTRRRHRCAKPEPKQKPLWKRWIGKLKRA